VTDTHTNM